MELFKSKEKEKPHRNLEVVANLDDILEKRRTFILKGEDYVMGPLTTEEFLIWSNALAGLYALEDKKGITADELINAYYEIIRPVVPALPKAILKDCTQQQIAGLFQIVTEHVTGRSGSLEEKKKIMERKIQGKT